MFVNNKVNNMTTKELIEELSKYPDDYEWSAVNDRINEEQSWLVHRDEFWSIDDIKIEL